MSEQIKDAARAIADLTYAEMMEVAQTLSDIFVGEGDTTQDNIASVLSAWAESVLGERP